MEAQLSALDAYIAEHTAQVQQASEASAEELLGHVQSLHAEHAQALAQVQQQVKQQAQQLAQAQAAEQALQQEQAAKKRPGSRAPSELKAASAAKPSAQAPPPKLPSRLSSGALAGAPAAADSGADSATAAAAVAAVTDVASRLDALGAQVAALEANARAAASGAGADATAAGADVVLLHRVATLEADVQALASAAGAAPSVGSAGSGSYAAVAQRVATLEADMQALASATSAAPTVGTGAGAGAGSDAALTQRLAVLEANMVTQVSAAGTAAPAAAAALTAGADGALAQRVATLEADVQALASASGAAAPAGAAPLSAGADAAMAQRVATLDADMEALASAAGSAVANSASMSSALADVFQRVEELEEALGAVSGGVAVGGDAHAAIAQLSAQLQNLEAELHAGLGEANALAADAGAEAAGEAAAHIMTLIAELGANVQRLSQAAEESDAAVAKVAQQQESLSLRVPLAAMGSQAAAAVTTVGNEEAMRKLRAEVAALAARLDAGGGGSSDAVRELQEKVDGLERQVAHSGAVVAPLIERQVQNMSRQMSRQSTSRNLDRAASNAALHEDTIGPLKQQVDELAARQEKDHAASMAASAAAVAEIAAAVSPMKQQLQELVTRQARQSAEIERLSGVHASMESLQERVAVQAEQAAKAVQLYVRVDGIEATVSQAAQAMQASQARVEVLEQQITFVAGQADADIGDIAARVSSLESGAASAAAVSELAARVEVLEGREAGEAPSDGQGMADVKRALAMLSVETCQQLQELKTASRPGTAAPGGPDVDDLSQALDVVSDKLNTRVNKLERLLGQGPAPLCCDNVIEAIEEINHNVSTLDALLRSSVEAYAAQQQKNLVPLFMTNGMPPPKAIPFDWAQPGGKFNAVNLSAVPSHSVLRAPGSGHNKHRDNAHSLNGGHGGGGHVYYAADDGGGGGGGGQVSTAAHDPASNRSSGDGGDSVVSSSDRREVKAPRTSLVIKQKVAPKHEDPPERKHLHSVGAGSSQLRARAASDASSTFDEWNQGAVRAGMSPPRMGMVPAGPGSKPVSMTGTVYTMGAASPANANTIPRPRTSSETGDHRSLATLPGGVRLSMNVRQSDNGGRQIHQYASMQQRTSEGGNGPQHFAHNAGHSMNGAGPSAGGGKTRAQYSLNSTALERSAGRL
ncbi:hypothetical protein FOA52_006461 [Chlamydomonas sp. UWO 241]|nr:hypothetical protein FOA52_006461 [Chlamydomonas sp. UWO 241]